MSNRPILATITGEYFQPVRLHYQVFDHSGLLHALKSLRCVNHDPQRQRWVWLYDHEARRLRFKQSYAKISKELRPIVIGSFFIRTKDKLLLDLRSCLRATLAIPFFDKHIPRSVARVTEAEVVNRLFSADDDPQLTPDRIFDHRPDTAQSPEHMLRGLCELTARIHDPLARIQIALEQIESSSRQPLPEIERFNVHYYEDGIKGFATFLAARQIVAEQHWLGNSGYTITDAIQSMIGIAEEEQRSYSPGRP